MEYDDLRAVDIKSQLDDILRCDFFSVGLRVYHPASFIVNDSFEACSVLKSKEDYVVFISPRGKWGVVKQSPWFCLLGAWEVV